MEIERKFTIKNIPFDLTQFEFRDIEQAYLCIKPVVRVRKENNKYYMTYKSEGEMAREEYNLPLTQKAYDHLLKKADGNIITKRRCLIPYKNHTIELDVFAGKFEGLIIAEIEFGSVEEAESFTPPDWFKDDVTFSKKYHNSYLSSCK